MKTYDAKNIRNIALLGHAGSGKTTLIESILFDSGVINRRGTVEDKNTVSDFSEIEHERGCSVYSTPVSIEYGDVKFNIIDNPGYDDFFGEVAASMRVADAALIVVDARNGVELGSELAWERALKENKPVAFCVNKIDMDQVDFQKTLDEIKDRFGREVTPLQVPVEAGASFDSIIDFMAMKKFAYADDSGKGAAENVPADQKDEAESLRNELVEMIAESDEELMNKYLEEGELTEEEFAAGLKKAIVGRQIYPLFVCCGKKNAGVDRLLTNIKNVMPSPIDLPAIESLEGNEIVHNADGPVSLLVYKMLSDPVLGDMTFFRVYSGTLKQSLDLVNEQKHSPERVGQIFATLGKKRVEVEHLSVGDLGATVKLKNTRINDTLHQKGLNVTIPPIDYPSPKVRTAIAPVTKGEEEKVGMAVNNLVMEDPSFKVEHSQELRQTILYGMGEQHYAAAKWRLENRYKVQVQYLDPRVPYRETIQKEIRGSYRHKKQSGGAGQFAEVHMIVAPWYEGMPDPADLQVRGRDLHDLDWGGKLEFINSIVGGVIDQRFMPAILKGVMEKMTFGPLTGSYVRDVRVVIYDGKMHPVDSNEAAFKMAGAMVFKDNFIKADPKILEPIYDVEIKAPEEFVGDVMSDLPSRRGVIQGIESEGRYQTIKARMPLAELDKYYAGLRSMTQARATYTQKFAEYQSVPGNIQQELIDAYKKKQEED